MEAKFQLYKNGVRTECLRPTPTDNLPILTGIEPVELRRNGATLSLARRAMEPGHLLHPAFTYHRVGTHGASNRDTYLYPSHNNLSVHLTTTTHPGALVGSPMECGVDGQPYNTPHFHPRHRHPLPLERPSQEQPGSGWFNRLRTGVGRFLFCLCKYGMASSAPCECGAEEQTVNNVVLQCPIHRPSHGLHGLTVLDDETVEWLLNTCPEI